MARSVLSKKKMTARAFIRIVRRRGLKFGSPPPCLAATVISLPSLAKTFLRLESTTPLVWLIFDHFEWPDMTTAFSLAGSIVSISLFRVSAGAASASGALALQVLGSGGDFFQAEDGIRDLTVTGVQTCALPI